MSPERDRRKHVRVRPTMEMPATLADPSDDAVLLRLVDISLGGIGMFIQRGNDVEPGATVELKMTLVDSAGKDKVIDVSAIVRHTSNEGALVGLEFVEVDQETRTVINHYVSELAERGAMA